MTEKHLEPDENGYYAPSKSQVKREMHALQELGEQLVELSNDKLRQLKVSDKMREAIKDAQRFTARGAKRRQLDYIGRLMRLEDAETIRHQLDVWENGSKAQAQNTQRLEAIRQLLLTQEQALTEFFDEFTPDDPQAFRSLVRNAQREAKKNAALTPEQQPSHKHYRQLYKSIKTIVEQNDS